MLLLRTAGHNAISLASNHSIIFFRPQQNVVSVITCKYPLSVKLSFMLSTWACARQLTCQCSVTEESLVVCANTRENSVRLLQFYFSDQIVVLITIVSARSHRHRFHLKANSCLNVHNSRVRPLHSLPFIFLVTHKLQLDLTWSSCCEIAPTPQRIIV